jgi:hypothetical protein
MSIVHDHFASLCRQTSAPAAHRDRDCYSAWGSAPDRRAKLLIYQAMGAILNACLHAEARKSVAESGDRALDLGHRSVILWDAIEAFGSARPRPKAPPLRSSSRSSSAVVRHGICRRVQQPSSGSTPHDRVTDLLIVLTASRLATAEHVQISASHRNSSDNLCGATPGAAHLSAACPQATYWLGSVSIPYPALGIQIRMTPAALLASRQRGFPS